jgi:hypothetical protein
MHRIEPQIKSVTIPKKFQNSASYREQKLLGGQACLMGTSRADGIPLAATLQLDFPLLPRHLLTTFPP